MCDPVQYMPLASPLLQVISEDQHEDRRPGAANANLPPNENGAVITTIILHKLKTVIETLGDIAKPFKSSKELKDLLFDESNMANLTVQLRLVITCSNLLVNQKEKIRNVFFFISNKIRMILCARQETLLFQIQAAAAALIDSASEKRACSSFLTQSRSRLSTCS